MKKFSKILVLLLSVALICTGLIFAVSADEAKAETVSYVQDGVTVEGTLEEAIANADDPSTVKLLGNCTVSETFKVSKDITVDLNGYELTTTCATAFEAQSGFTITGTGKITSAGTLVKATGEGASVNITGTGIDGITILHTGSAEAYELVWLVSNNELSVTNARITSTAVIKKGYKRLFYTENGGTETFNKCYVYIATGEDTGYAAQCFMFANVAGDTKITIENSGFYSHNAGFDLRFANNTGNKVLEVKNSVISCNNTSTNALQRTAIVVAADSDGKFGKGIVHLEDSTLECSGRMFASDHGDYMPDFVINGYGSTFKVLRSESDNGTGQQSHIARHLDVNFYNSESGKSCRLLLNETTVIQQNVSGKYWHANAYEPGMRVNLKEATTAGVAEDSTTGKKLDHSYGIRVPAAFDEDGNVTEWTYAKDSDRYQWVYDPIGDPQAPYVLVDTEETGTVSTPAYAYGWNYDSVVLNQKYDKTFRKEYANTHKSSLENITGTMHIGVFRGSLVSDYETGNAYLKYVVTPYDEAYGVAVKDIYGADYDNSYRNFTTEKNKDAETRNAAGSNNNSKADPYITAGYKDLDATTYTNTGFANNNVVVVNFDFGTDSEYGFPALTLVTQARSPSAGNLSSDQKKNLTISNQGVIGNKLDNQSEGAYTKLEIGEWYHFSIVNYTKDNLAYIYINGQLMGTSTIATVDIPDDAYVQGYRININATSDHVVNSSFALDNVTVASYTDYATAAEAEARSAETALNYVIEASPRKYMFDALTVYGMPVGSTEEAAALANKLGTKIEVNSDINLYDVEANVVIDSKGNEINVVDGPYGYVVDGNKYTFNEDYWYNAYIYTGDISKITDSSYTDEDFTFATKVKLGFEVDIENYYTTETPNYMAHTINTQNGWVYEYGDTESSVLPKVADLSDYDRKDENKNVNYFPFFAAVPMTYYVEEYDADAEKWNCVAGGLENDDAVSALYDLTDGQKFVLQKDITIKNQDLFYKNNSATVDTNGTKTVNDVVIDNDYTEEEIEKMREAAADIQIDLNGNTLHLSNARVFVSHSVELSIYSSKPGAEINMMYLDGSSVTSNRTFHIMYVDDDVVKGEIFTDKSSNPDINDIYQADADMTKNYNSYMNFGTYTDRNGDVVESERITMTGGAIFEPFSGDNSCAMNINNITATRVTSTSMAMIITRAYDGKINVKNSVLTSVLASGNKNFVHVTKNTETVYPEIVFDNCVMLGTSDIHDVLKEAGTDKEIKTQNVIFNNCVTSGRFNPGSYPNVYFGEGTKGAYISTANRYTSNDLSLAYTFEPMTLGSFADNGSYFKKVRIPVYDANVEGNINYENYVYYVDNGYAAQFETEYPGVDYRELPVLSQKVAKKSDIVTVTFNKLNGEAGQNVPYVKGSDVTAFVYAKGEKALEAVTIDETYDAQSVTLTYTGWETLPTDVQANVVVNPTYTVKANVKDFKVNLSLYADFNINLYMPEKYGAYATIWDGNTQLPTSAQVIGETSYLMATVSQMCNKAGDDVVFTIKVAEEVNGKTCEATATVTTSITDYASAIFAGEFEDQHKVLMYYMLNYANEAEKYMDEGVADETVTALLAAKADYADKYVVDYTYDELCSTSGLTAAIKEVTLAIDSTPAFKFTLVDGFAGTITVTYATGQNTRTYTVDADASRTITIENMKIYNFGTILEITAVGTVNGESVEATGSYSLDTFANWHKTNSENAESETQATSEACMPLVKAIFAYAEVAELYKTGTLQGALEQDSTGEVTE